MAENQMDPTTDNTASDGTVQLDGVPNLPDLPPTLESLGPYQVCGEIGRGAMGTVYKAVHSQLQRTVALKVLPPELAESPLRLKRFRREMTAIGRLEHPNIVLATDAGEADGLCYIAMQFIDGQDLGAILENVGRFEPADACEIIRQTALGLQHIHEQQLVHRDIKPSNIVLTKNGEVKILDLGIAMLRQVDDRETAMTAVGSLMGTPDYIAPEQISQCAAVDIRADIYSLGCTLYGLLSGTPPFTGPGYTTFTAKLIGHADRQPPDLGQLCPELPAALVQFVQRLMSKSPDQRPAEPAEVAQAIREFCADADLIPVATGQCKHKRVAVERSVEGESSQPRGLTVRVRAISTVAVGLCLIAVTIAYGVMTPSNVRPTTEQKQLPISPVVHHVSSSQKPESAPEIPPIAMVPPDLAATINQDVSHAIESIAVSNEQIEKNTSELVVTLDGLRKQFSGIAPDRKRIPAALSPADHYANACRYSDRGDLLKARKSYLTYFADELPVVDPHLQFIQLLKLQDGIAGARELYAALPGDHEAPARRLANAMLQPKEQRIALLETLTADHREFAPAYYYLCREVRGDNLTNQTLGQQTREKELLLQFQELHDRGHLLKHFLDQSKAVTMLDEVKQRLRLLASVDTSHSYNPVKFTLVVPTPEHWMIALQIDEGAIDVQYRVGEEGDFTSLGLPNVFIGGAPMMDPRTLKPMPKTSLELPTDTPRCTLYIKYIDANSKVRGPYPLDFEPDTTRAQYYRPQIEATKSTWLTLVDQWMIFNVFQHGRSAIKSVVYGLDEEVPKRDKAIPEIEYDGELDGPYAMQIPTSLKFATIQVTYVDGTKSEIVRINRAAE